MIVRFRPAAKKEWNRCVGHSASVFATSVLGQATLLERFFVTVIFENQIIFLGFASATIKLQ
jgi:hypothetical protein